jgi:hypothetical protein
MARRFSDVSRGGELKVAMDNYNKYKTDITTRKSPRITGTGTPKNRLIDNVGVIPFSVAVVGATPQVYIVGLVRVGAADPDAAGGGTPDWAKAKMDNYYDPTPPDGAISAPRGFRAARASTFEPSDPDGPGKYTKSKFTGLYYSKRPGTGRQYPIGRAKAAPSLDEIEVKKAIKADLITELNAVNYRRLSFSDERGARA